jgi:hypothetical protein
MATTTEVLWSEQGALACPAHAPFKGSDTWVYERWRPITTAERAEFERDVGRPPECETCRSIARRRGLVAKAAFEHPETGAVVRAVHDAREGEVRFLVDGEATRNAIKRALGALARRVQDRDEAEAFAKAVAGERWEGWQ